MIYLKLFLTFLEIGAFSFGGGYGMISLMREKSLLNGWLTEDELLNIIAVSESTPGPIAVNMATFIGSSQAGFFGGLIATLGVVLPSFIVILIISMFLKNLIKHWCVKSFLSGVRPAVIGLILGTAATMLLANVFEITSISSSVSVDYRALGILVIIVVLSALLKKIMKKKPSPILMICVSAFLGVLFYGA
jgi:chromate transporter